VVMRCLPAWCDVLYTCCKVSHVYKDHFDLKTTNFIWTFHFYFFLFVFSILPLSYPFFYILTFHSDTSNKLLILLLPAKTITIFISPKSSSLINSGKYCVLKEISSFVKVNAVPLLFLFTSVRFLYCCDRFFYFYFSSFRFQLETSFYACFVVCLWVLCCVFETVFLDYSF